MGEFGSVPLWVADVVGQEAVDAVDSAGANVPDAVGIFFENQRTISGDDLPVAAGDFAF